MIDISDGINFECKKCGACCIKPGYVYLNGDDIEKISEYMQLSELDFRTEYTTKDDGWLVLKSKGQKCFFYDKEKGCKINKAKPLQCTSWPFWESNMRSDYFWVKAKKICPGIGKGKLYTDNDIRQILHDS